MSAKSYDVQMRLEETMLRVCELEARLENLEAMVSALEKPPVAPVNLEMARQLVDVLRPAEPVTQPPPAPPAPEASVAPVVEDPRQLPLFVAPPEMVMDDDGSSNTNVASW